MLVGFLLITFIFLTWCAYGIGRDIIRLGVEYIQFTEGCFYAMFYIMWIWNLLCLIQVSPYKLVITIS